MRKKILLLSLALIMFLTGGLGFNQAYASPQVEGLGQEESIEEDNSDPTKEFEIRYQLDGEPVHTYYQGAGKLDPDQVPDIKAPYGYKIVYGFSFTSETFSLEELLEIEVNNDMVIDILLVEDPEYIAMSERVNYDGLEKTRVENPEELTDEEMDEILAKIEAYAEENGFSDLILAIIPENNGHVRIVYIDDSQTDLYKEDLIVEEFEIRYQLDGKIIHTYKQGPGKLDPDELPQVELEFGYDLIYGWYVTEEFYTREELLDLDVNSDMLIDIIVRLDPDLMPMSKWANWAYLEKTYVKDPDNISEEEKEEIEKDILYNAHKNPHRQLITSIEVRDDGSALVVYKDGGQVQLDSEDLIRREYLIKYEYAGQTIDRIYQEPGKFKKSSLTDVEFQIDGYLLYRWIEVNKFFTEEELFDINVDRDMVFDINIVSNEEELTLDEQVDFTDLAKLPVKDPDDLSGEDIEALKDKILDYAKEKGFDDQIEDIKIGKNGLLISFKDGQTAYYDIHDFIGQNPDLPGQAEKDQKSDGHDKKDKAPNTGDPLVTLLASSLVAGMGLIATKKKRR